MKKMQLWMLPAAAWAVATLIMVAVAPLRGLGASMMLAVPYAFVAWTLYCHGKEATGSRVPEWTRPQWAALLHLERRLVKFFSE